jgi:hypothetical protein
LLPRLRRVNMSSGSLILPVCQVPPPPACARGGGGRGLFPARSIGGHQVCPPSTVSSL